MRSSLDFFNKVWYFAQPFNGPNTPRLIDNYWITIIRIAGCVWLLFLRTKEQPNSAHPCHGSTNFYLEFTMFAKCTILFVLFSTLFPASALAGTSYTDQATWEAAIPYAASVTEITFSGTPGDTVAPSGSYTGISSLDMIYGDHMYYDSTGSQICIEPSGSTPSRFELYLEANTFVFGMQVSGVPSGLKPNGAPRPKCPWT